MRGWRKAALGALSLLLAVAPAAPGQAARYLRLKVLAVVYTHTFADQATRAEVLRTQREIDEAAEFFWRASRMRLHLAVDTVTVERFVPRSSFSSFRGGGYWFNDRAPDGTRMVENDLLGLGFRRDDYDVIAVFYAWQRAPTHKAQYGGAAWGVNRILGKAAYLAIPMAGPPERQNRIFEHELLHTFHSISLASGQPDFPDVHGVKAFKRANGKGASWPAWILANLSDSQYFGLSGHWGSVASFSDRDGDGLPDASPPGDALWITEAILGSSPSLVDTDRDGIGDLEEVVAGPRQGTDPTKPDTDGDGLDDAEDPAPFAAQRRLAWRNRGLPRREAGSAGVRVGH